MPKKSIPSIPTRAKPTSLIASLTAQDRFEQDQRLNMVIPPLWQDETLLDVRRGLQWAHAHIHRVTAVDVGRGYDWYVNGVLGLAMPGDAPFIPVDMWPWEPPRYTYTREAYSASQIVINLLRKGVGLFTPSDLTLNKHYALLIAHILLCPDDIVTAETIPDPYPWPFVIRRKAQGTPYVEVQVDAESGLRRAAARVEGALHKSLQQAEPLPYGALSRSPLRQQPASPKPKTMKLKRRQLAELVARLLEEDHSRTYKDIFDNDEFKAALKRLDIFMCALSNLTELMKQYSAETGWQRPKRKRDWTR